MTATLGTRKATITLRHLPFIPERRPVSTGVPSESRVMIGSSPGQLFGPGSVRKVLRTLE